MNADQCLRCGDPLLGHARTCDPLDEAHHTIEQLTAERDRLLAAIGAALSICGSAGGYRSKIRNALIEGLDTKTAFFLGHPRP